MQTAAAPVTAYKPTQTELALGRLSRLSQAGAAPDRMVGETKIVLAAWAADELTDVELRNRVNELRENLEAGLEAAEEAAGDVDRDDRAEVARVGRVLDGICAALHVVRDVMGVER